MMKIANEELIKQVLDNPKVFPALINRERNVDILKKSPHKDFLDLAVVFKCVVDNEHYVNINNWLAKKMNMDVEDLFSQALRDQGKIFSWRTIEVEADFIGVTNEEYTYGAAVMLDTEYLNCQAEKMGSDLYILPSSVHDIIILPQNKRMIEMLKESVIDINRNPELVREEDFLSDHVYQYTKSTREVTIAI